MSDQQPPNRLEDIDARLKAAQNARAEKHKAGFRERENSRSMGLGMRIGIELVVAVLAGGGIGLFIDNRLNTTPIFMLAFLALGFTAGVLNVVRIGRGLDEAVGVGRAVREKQDREAGAHTDEADEKTTKAPE